MADGDEKIRVLWLTPDKPETISVGRRRIAERLDEIGFRVTLRATTPRTALASLAEGSYDVAVGTTRSGAFAGTALKLRGTPLVVDHIDPIRQFAETRGRGLALWVRLAENLAFRLADHVLFVYDEERPRVERYARTATQTSLGVEFDAFADPDLHVLEAARERLAEAGVETGTETDERLLIYVGGLEPIYHIRELLGAVAHLDGWRLVVLGAGSLEREVKNAESERIAFLGSVGHEWVPGYLHAADVGISLVEDPHTLKVLEYAAAGLPVVGLRGRAESRFGEFVEFCDSTPESIARTVLAAGERGADEDFRAAVERFDYERVAKTYGKVLKAVVRSHDER